MFTVVVAHFLALQHRYLSYCTVVCTAFIWAVPANYNRLYSTYNKAMPDTQQRAGAQFQLYFIFILGVKALIGLQAVCK